MSLNNYGMSERTDMILSDINGLIENMNREDPPLTHAESFRKTVTELKDGMEEVKKREAAEGSKVDDLLTATDRHKMQFYMNMPDMIIKTSEWESFGVCSACKNQINIKHYCLRYYNAEHGPGEHHCPTCNVASVTVRLKDSSGKPLYNSNRNALYEIFPIPHERYRKRYHTVQEERRKPWWKFWATYRAGEGFWEIAHIPHVTPLVTKPVQSASTKAEEKLIDALCTIEDLKHEINLYKTLLPISSLSKGVSGTHEPASTSPPTKPKRVRTKKTSR